MSGVLLFKILHVFLAFWLVSGLIGRWVIMKQAENTQNIYNTLAFVTAAEFFERFMVIPGSLAVVLLGLITGIIGGWPVLGFLQGGDSNWLLVSLLLFLSLIPVIRWVFLPRRKILDQALEDAIARGVWTARLASAFNDPINRAAHIYEMVNVALIVFLMVAKPF